MCYCIVRTCAYCTWISTISYYRCDHALASSLALPECPFRMARKHEQGQGFCTWCANDGKRSLDAPPGGTTDLDLGSSKVCVKSEEEYAKEETGLGHNVAAAALKAKGEENEGDAHSVLRSEDCPVPNVEKERWRRERGKRKRAVCMKNDEWEEQDDSSNGDCVDHAAERRRRRRQRCTPIPGSQPYQCALNWRKRHIRSFAKDEK